MAVAQGLLAALGIECILFLVGLALFGLAREL